MARMKISLTFILALSLALANSATALINKPSGTQASAHEALPYFTEPAVSPDRSEIAFVSGGDIWTAPTGGGEARLLVSHAAMESRPLYSPDGKKLAFVSTRTGNGDIYVLALDTGELRRLTFDEALECTSIHSVAGTLAPGSGLLRIRPFRSPHHTISDVALVGGGSHPRPGSPSRRAASLRRSGGARAIRISMNAKSG